MELWTKSLKFTYQETDFTESNGMPSSPPAPKSITIYVLVLRWKMSVWCLLGFLVRILEFPFVATLFWNLPTMLSTASFSPFWAAFEVLLVRNINAQHSPKPDGQQALRETGK